MAGGKEGLLPMDGSFFGDVVFRDRSGSHHCRKTPFSDFDFFHRCHVITADGDMSGRWDTRTRDLCWYNEQLEGKDGKN